MVSTRLLNHENIYSLEPSGHRGAISFQQYRAFQLVAALNSFYGEDLKTKKIAVIGGGVAGLSVAAALYTLGCLKVQGFEAEKLMHKQKQSGERLVHPDYNRWPMLGAMHNFTNFQILNWFAGPAYLVADRIVKSFKKITTGNTGRKNLIFKEGMTLVDFNPDDNDNSELIFEDHGKELDPKTFQLVILTTGFGIRAHDIHYWNPKPSFKGLAEDKNTQSITIFGTGDSALIDLFNCFLGTPNENSLWNMMLGYASLFRNERWSKIEDDSRHAQGTGYIELEKEIRTHELSKRALISSMVRFNSKSSSKSEMEVLNDLSTAEKTFYEGLVKNEQFKDQVINFLEPFLVKIDEPQFTKPNLIGLLDTPFQPTQAPINKLFLAFLTSNDLVNYEKRQKHYSDKQIAARGQMPGNHTKKNPFVSHIGASNKSGSDADPNIGEIFGIGATEKMVSSLLNFSTSVDAVPKEFYWNGDVGGSAHNQMIEDYKDQVIQFFKGLGCTNVTEPNNDPAQSREFWLVTFERHKKDDIIKKILSKGGLEKQIAGFPIQWQFEKIVGGA